MRFRGGGRRAGLVLACVLALFGTLAFTQVSAASKLTLTAPTRPAVEKAARCAGNTVSITINGSAVAVTGLNASACAGRTLRVFMRAGGVAQSVSTTISGSTANLTLGTAPTTVDGATATIATWPVPVTWSQVVKLPALSCTIPASPSIPCVVTQTREEAWGDRGARVWQRTYSLTTTSSQVVDWRVTINLSDASFPFLTRRLHSTDGHAVLDGTPSCSTNPRIVTVVGHPGWSSVRLSSTQPVTLQLRGDESGTGGNLLNC